MPVKLERGFKQGVYCVGVDYEQLAERIGFEKARRKAITYTQLLHEQMGHMRGFRLDGIEDFSHSGDPRRKRDLESTFLSFALTANDGLWHDAAMKRQFQTAPMRADQQWDQHQADLEARRRDHRRERFRRRLESLLEGDAYGQLDAATKKRLLTDVTALVLLPKEREL
jgi:hypothetical protein